VAAQQITLDDWESHGEHCYSSVIGTYLKPQEGLHASGTFKALGITA
jgi:hypothetical protein